MNSRLVRAVLWVALSSLLQLDAGNRLHAQSRPDLSAMDNAKLLQKDITDASNKKDYSLLIRLIEQYKQLPAAPRVAAFDYLEAWAAYYTGDHKRALSAAVVYAKAPDGQQYHEEALELIHKIQHEDRQKAEEQLRIHWTSGVSSKPAVRQGQAIVEGQVIKVLGLTLTCDSWTWVLENGHFVNGPIQKDLENFHFGYDAGRTAASQFWTRNVQIRTFHFIDPHYPDPGATHHRPPWEGYYPWPSSGEGSWFSYAKQSDGLFVLYDIVGHPAVASVAVYDENGHERSGVNRFDTQVYFDVELKSFEVHERIKPTLACVNPNRSVSTPTTAQWQESCRQYEKGFQSITDAQPPLCRLIPYRQPPNPEPSP